MANQVVHKRITNIEELIGRSHAILEDRLNRLESLLLSDPARASIAETTMMWQLLYGAVARFGMSIGGPEVAAVQLPLLNVPPNHRLLWDKDETTGLVRISIVADSVPGLDPSVADEGQLTPEEARQDSSTVNGPDGLAEPPSSRGGFIIEDEPFVDEDAALEAEMTEGVREE
jgi:hypothetical protein